MAGPPEHTFNELEVEDGQIRELAACLLHTVLFQRQLAPCFPVEESLHDTLAMPVFYSRVGNDATDVVARVSRAAEALQATVERQRRRSPPPPGETRRCRLVLSVGPQQAPFERWVFHLTVVDRCNQVQLQQRLTDVLREIVTRSDQSLQEVAMPPSRASCVFAITHDTNQTSAAAGGMFKSISDAFGRMSLLGYR
eukprot:TRINITY_DN17456_c1_g1_i1.p2 TRINITY_DN17456_c1_g1~~TRINITY_DN17456_c1_g1_i1.p2  ORF type:complete len:228 (+),score=55.27 TRINITY_DN17456_c1_g1_i1:98-685(+)